MHSFPLLSEAYVAALLTPHPDPEPEERRPDRRLIPPAAQKPERAPREEQRPPAVTRVEKEDGDIETARTRPLRLDRIHL
jgi:hypothetical protein